MGSNPSYPSLTHSYTIMDLHTFFILNRQVFRSEKRRRRKRRSGERCRPFPSLSQHQPQTPPPVFIRLLGSFVCPESNGHTLVVDAYSSMGPSSRAPTSSKKGE